MKTPNPTPEEIETAKKVIELLPKLKCLCNSLQSIFPDTHYGLLIETNLPYFYNKVGNEYTLNYFGHKCKRKEKPMLHLWFTTHETRNEGDALYRIRRIKEVYNL